MVIRGSVPAAFPPPPTTRPGTQNDRQGEPLMTDSQQPPEDLGPAVALVGMAGRFPGADDVRGLWAGLRACLRRVKEANAGVRYTFLSALTPPGPTGSHRIDGGAIEGREDTKRRAALGRNNAGRHDQRAVVAPKINIFAMV